MPTSAVDTLLSDPAWEWRYSRKTFDTEEENKAAAFLRSQADKARSWLLGVSEAVGLRLPIGNGANGPWHRLAVTDGSKLGILSIADGTLSITDASVPDFVTLFTVKGSAVSPNLAGGSGSLPKGWGQIMLLLFVDTVPTPSEAKITDRVWGFRTCYGTTGTAPEPIEGVRDRETVLPQWEDLDNREVDPDTWERLMETAGDDDVRLRPGYMTVGAVELHTISVFGTPAHRRTKLAALWEKWVKLATDEANKPLESASVDDDLNELLQKVVLRRRQFALD